MIFKSSISLRCVSEVGRFSIMNIIMKAEIIPTFLANCQLKSHPKPAKIRFNVDVS